MSDSLRATFGPALAPVLEKMSGNEPDRFQVDLNVIAQDDIDEAYERLKSDLKSGVSLDETHVAHFALIQGAKALRNQFHAKEREKITDVRDGFMLGMAHEYVRGDETLRYDMGVFYHEKGQVFGYKWNELPPHDLTLDARKKSVYDAYTRNVYECVVAQDKQVEQLMPSEADCCRMSADEKIQDIKYFIEKGADFFTVPEPTYQSLAVQEMIDYSLYLGIKGDVDRYLQQETPKVQKFKNALENGESFNVLELRAAWWSDKALALK